MSTIDSIYSNFVKLKNGESNKMSSEVLSFAVSNLASVSFFGSVFSSPKNLALKTGSIGLAGMLPLSGPLFIGIGFFIKRYMDNRKQEKIEASLKAIYKEGFEQAEELTKALKKSENEKQKLIKMNDKLIKYIETASNQKELSGSEIAAINYAKGVTDNLKIAN